jgi:hypothetical protein
MEIKNGHDPLTRIEFIINHPMVINFNHRNSLMATKKVSVATLAWQPKRFLITM